MTSATGKTWRLLSKVRALKSQKSEVPILVTNTHTCSAKISVGSPELIECARKLTFPEGKRRPRTLRGTKRLQAAGDSFPGMK